jgi:hypothetical protein
LGDQAPPSQPIAIPSGARGPRGPRRVRHAITQSVALPLDPRFSFLQHINHHNFHNRVLGCRFISSRNSLDIETQPRVFRFFIVQIKARENPSLSARQVKSSRGIVDDNKPLKDDNSTSRCVISDVERSTFQPCLRRSPAAIEAAAAPPILEACDQIQMVRIEVASAPTVVSPPVIAGGRMVPEEPGAEAGGEDEGMEGATRVALADSLRPAIMACFKACAMAPSREATPSASTFEQEVSPLLLLSTDSQVDLRRKAKAIPDRQRSTLEALEVALATALAPSTSQRWASHPLGLESHHPLSRPIATT